MRHGEDGPDGPRARPSMAVVRAMLNVPRSILPRQALNQVVGFPTLLLNFSFLTTTNLDLCLCMLQGTCLGDCLLSVGQDCAHRKGACSEMR